MIQMEFLLLVSFYFSGACTASTALNLRSLALSAVRVSFQFLFVMVVSFPDFFVPACFLCWVMVEFGANCSVHSLLVWGSSFCKVGCQYILGSCRLLPRGDRFLLSWLWLLFCWMLQTKYVNQISNANYGHVVGHAVFFPRM